MATSSNVTILRSWDEGTKGGKLAQSLRHATIALTSDGGTSGDIPASLFNLAEIYEAYSLSLDVSGTLSSLPVVLDASGAGILTTNPSTGALADTTGTLTVVVKGRST